MSLRPSWPRFALESALLKSIEDTASGRCVNIGCGTTGRYHELLTKFSVEGVDTLPPRSKCLPWPYHQADALDLPFESSSFDLVLAIESFEHIDANQEAMADLARVLKPGGRAIITTPTQWTWPFEFGRHAPHYYSRHALVNLITANGLQIDNVTPCGRGASYFLNLIKNWLSPVGMRVFRSHWWAVIDGVLTPGYIAATYLDRLLPFPPTNWVVNAHKKT